MIISDKVYDKLININKNIISDVIKLSYLKVLRLYSKNKLSIYNFNDKWIVSFIGTIFTISINSLSIDYIFKFLENIYKDELSKDILKLTISILYTLFLKFIFMFIVTGKSIYSNMYLRSGLISIFILSFYNIMINPLFGENNISNYFSVLNRDMLITIASDFINDGDIDTAFNEIVLNLFGSIFKINLNGFIFV